MKTARDLLPIAQGQQALSPEHKRFNQLLARIDKARAELQAWQDQALHFAQGHAARVRPLEAELLDCQAALIRRLDALLHERMARLGKSDRRRVREEICDLIAGLLDATADDALADEMKALFERHAGHDLDSENREAVAAMKEMLEAMSGLDLGDQDFDSEEELMQAAHRRMAEQNEQAEAARARRKPRRRSAAQSRREQEQQEATQSLREVFRKLAAAIHPDRADDDADRERRHALMQRANRAYEAQDLLALLALQLEIEQVDADHLARASAERLRAYTRLLNDQLREIESELEGRRLALCAEFDLDPMPLPRAGELGALLERLLRERRADLAQARRDLEQLADAARARETLRRRWREVNRWDDEIPF